MLQLKTRENNTDIVIYFSDSIVIFYRKIKSDLNNSVRNDIRKQQRQYPENFSCIILTQHLQKVTLKHALYILELKIFLIIVAQKILKS